MGYLTCFNCCIGFTLSDAHEQRLRDSHNTFYCPNGHSQVFKGKPDSQKIQELQESLDWERKNNIDGRTWRDNTIRTLKGHITRIKRKAGLLPPKVKGRGRAR